MKFLIAIAASVLMPLMIFPAAMAGADFLPEYDRFVLDNGLEVVIVENHRLPLIDLNLVFHFGSGLDSATMAGLACVTARMLEEGTENYSLDRLKASIDSTGGAVDIYIGQDMTIIWGDFLARELEFALRILSEMARRPVFTDEKLSVLKRRLVSSVMQEEAIPVYHLRTALYERIFGGDGYGLPPRGTHHGLREIDLPMVRKFYDDYFQPNNASLILAGDIDSEAAAEMVREYFADWPAGPDIVRPPVTIERSDSLRILLLDNPEAPSSEFIIGCPVGRMDADDAPALLLLDYILGSGGRVSRLSRSLVDDLHLATEISSMIKWHRPDGVFTIWGKGPNESAADAVVAALDVIADLRSIRVPVREIDEARSHHMGIIPQYFESSRAIVSQFGALLTLGFDLDFYEKLPRKFEAVDPSRLREVASEYLAEDRLIIVIVGPETELKSDLSGLGELEIRSLSRH